MAKTPRIGGPKVPYVVNAAVSEALWSVGCVKLDLFGTGVCEMIPERGSVPSRDS